MTDRFQARYRGKRYSSGYPACPDLADQATIFKLLLDGCKIGVELTEGFMMDPEASVSAFVVHHPQARYYAVVAPRPVILRSAATKNLWTVSLEAKVEILAALRMTGIARRSFGDSVHHWLPLVPLIPAF
mgnify:CR=1 FL=1